MVIKAKVISDFAIQMTREKEEYIRKSWFLYVNVSSNGKGSGARIILELLITKWNTKHKL